MKQLISLILVLMTGVFFSTSVLSGDVPKPILNKETWKGSQCVEPLDDIRRNHMKYLLHHRNKTVHEGIRTKQHSLKECIECHVTTKTEDGKPISVKSRQHFCNTCHAYAGVTLDCFQCHATHPDSGQVRATMPLQSPMIQQQDQFHANWQAVEDVKDVGDAQ